MEVLLKECAKRNLAPGSRQSRIVDLALSATTTPRLHFGAYNLSNGYWGVIVLKPTPEHKCRSCDTKMELLALATALDECSSGVDRFTIYSTTSYITKILKAIPTNQWPSWDYCNIRGQLFTSLSQLNNVHWGLGSNQPIVYHTQELVKRLSMLMANCELDSLETELKEELAARAARSFA